MHFSNAHFMRRHKRYNYKTVWFMKKKIKRILYILSNKPVRFKLKYLLKIVGIRFISTLQFVSYHQQVHFKSHNSTPFIWMTEGRCFNYTSHTFAIEVLRPLHKCCTKNRPFHFACWMQWLNFTTHTNKKIHRNFLPTWHFRSHFSFSPIFRQELNSLFG